MTAWQMQIRITGVIYILAGGRGDVQVATRVVARYLAEHQVLEHVR